MHGSVAHHAIERIIRVGQLLRVTGDERHVRSTVTPDADTRDREVETVQLKLAAPLEPCQEKASPAAEIEDALLGLEAKGISNERELPVENEPRSGTAERVDLQLRPVLVLPLAL